MRKEIEITIPTSWSDVTLRKYLDLQKDIQSYEDNEEAQTAFTIYHLCGIDAKALRRLSAESYNVIREKLENFIGNTEHELKRIITIDGIEYGFEPNLSKISYGAYADITKYKTITIDENWCDIMSILYRPINKKQGENYSIQAYDGTGNAELFKDLSMDIHFGALFFFVHLSTDLLNSTLNFTMATMKGLPPNFTQTLRTSGELTQRLLNLQTETSKK